ncbi:MAG: ATP-binding cassette domain-containing protein [Actinomycetota bacterium]
MSRPVTDAGTEVGLVAELGIRRNGFELDVSLTIDEGSTVGLLGPNGAGKSTVIAAIAGLLPLDRGSIRVGGRALDEPASDTFVRPEDRRLGIVFQGSVLFDHLSVVDNVAFAVRHRAAPGPGVARPRRRRAAREAVRPLLDALDLAGLADARPRQLSGGQAQRVALARALAGDPQLLLLDEPLAAVDVSTRADLRRVLTEHLAGFAGPRLLVTHDPGEAFALADRLVAIEDGRVVQQGTATEVQRHPATPWVAALTGTNLLAGRARRSRIHLDDHDVVLTTATELEGPVRAVIDPRAVSLHRERPEGSPRNAWAATVDWVEPLGRTTRVRLGAPLPLTVDITPSSADALGLGPGRPIWAAVKATEITVEHGDGGQTAEPVSGSDRGGGG